MYSLYNPYVSILSPKFRHLLYTLESYLQSKTNSLRGSEANEVSNKSFADSLDENKTAPKYLKSEKIGIKS